MISHNFGLRQETEITMKGREYSSLIMHLLAAFQELKCPKRPRILIIHDYGSLMTLTLAQNSAM